MIKPTSVSPKKSQRHRRVPGDNWQTMYCFIIAMIQLPLFGERLIMSTTSFINRARFFVEFVASNSLILALLRIIFSQSRSLVQLLAGIGFKTLTLEQNGYTSDFGFSTFGSNTLLVLRETWPSMVPIAKQRASARKMVHRQFLDNAFDLINGLIVLGAQLGSNLGAF